MELRTAGSHGLPQQGLAPQSEFFMHSTFPVVGLLENINCLSSGGWVPVKDVNPENRMRRSISVKAKTGAEYRCHRAVNC